MSVFLDIALSFFIGGILILLIMNANFVVGQTWSYYTSEAIVQKTLLDISQILETELRNMGAGIVSGTGTIITEATDTSIQFRFVPYGSSNEMLVKYYKGSTDELTTTDNPWDAYLYRQENNSTPQPIGIVTRFNIQYLQNRMIADGSGNIVFDGTLYLNQPVDPTNIEMIEITLEVQNPYSLMSLTEENSEDPRQRYAQGVWRQTRLASHNLQR